MLTVQQLTRRGSGRAPVTHYGVGKHQVGQLVAVVEDQTSSLDACMKARAPARRPLHSVQERLPEQAGDAPPRLAQVGAEACKAATEAGWKLTRSGATGR